MSEKKTFPIPTGWFEKHFPKCINCGEKCIYMHGVPHPEVAICGKCAREELEIRLKKERSESD